MDMSPTDVGYKFRSPMARKLIDKHQSIEQRWGFFQNACWYFYFLQNHWDTRVEKSNFRIFLLAKTAFPVYTSPVLIRGYYRTGY